MRKALSLLLTVFLIFLVAFSLAESYEASTMRLLQHSGAVEIFDVSGAPRFLLDNVRFASGESLKTGEDGSASVSLDDTKILTMDFNSWVEFLQEAGHMQLNLLEGSLFLDVQKKLDENESFDIQTTTMTVGIRGTLIFVSDGKAASAAAVDDDCITIGILEGGGRFSFTDPSGAKRVFDASAGQKVSIPKKKNNQEAAPQVSEMSSADVPEYVTKKVLSDETLTNRVTNGSTGGGSLLIPMTLPENALPQGSGFGAKDNWFWNSEVTIVAQSASKLYDSVPLMRTSDALVYGLPGNFNISVTASGSQTDAGTAKNVITSYTITNSAGENVNSHFTNIRTVEGSLVVDPAPLIVWTGSAEKVYDGTPLTCPEAGIRTVPGHTPEDPAWKNSSLVTQTAAGSEKMVAISGSTYVQGTNPLTGETEKIELQAGQSLSVNLHDEGNNQSIEFEIKTLKEEDLPDEVLQIYASNPEMLAQACAQTGWDPEVIKKRIAGIQPAQATTVSGTGLNVTQDAKDSLMTDSTHVRIHIDSDITNYTTRSLTGD